MNRVILFLAFTAALGFGQTVGSFPSVVGTGGGSGGQNASATSVPAVTSLAIDITSLNASSVDKVLVQCWSGAAAPFSPVTITSLNPASTTSITANFGSTANVTCRANATGVGATGAAGTPGATGATGPAGANGTNGTNGAISQLQDEGSNLTVRPTINFTGAGVTATDDAGNNRTNVTISGGGGGGSPDIQVGGSLIGTQPAINFIAGTGGVIAGVDDAGNSRVNVTINPDSAIYLTRATGQSGTDLTCIPASASGTAYTCSMAGNALTAYTNGMRVMFRPDAACSGTPTLNINTLGAKKLFAADGTTGATCSSGLSYWLIYNSSLDTAAGAWTFPAAGSGGGVSSVSGTTNEITSTGGATPVLSLSSTMNLTSKTVRVPNSTSLPGTCTVGDSYMDTDATTARRWFLCESTNTWVAQGGGGATTQIIQLPATYSGGAGGATPLPAGVAGGIPGMDSGFPGNVNYPNTGTPVLMWILYLPSNWNSSTAITVRAQMTERSGNSGTYQMEAALNCIASGETFNSAFSTGSYNTSSTTGLVTRPSANATQYVTMTSVSSTGCVAGEVAYLAIWRNNSVGTLAGPISLIHAAVEIGVQ